jgi:hypothetical protein
VTNIHCQLDRTIQRFLQQNEPQASAVLGQVTLAVATNAKDIVNARGGMRNFLDPP